MSALRKLGGQRVGPGHYWDPVYGESVHLDSEATLPGDAARTYYKLPVVVLLLAAPLMGLAYVIFLPFIGFAMVAAALTKKAFGRTAAGLSKAMAFGWRPSEAYLSGAEEEEDEEKADRKAHSAEDTAPEKDHAPDSGDRSDEES